MELDQVPETHRLGGIATVEELIRAGMSRAAVRGAVRRGELVRVSRGMYARTGATAAPRPADPHRERVLRLCAALAICGRSAVASHDDAAIAHQLALLDHPAVDVTVTRPPGVPGSRTSRSGIRLHIAALPARHVTVRDGIPVTTVARTVVDIARTTPFKSGVVVADSALASHLTSKGELSAVIRECSRWPGIARAREVVDFSDQLAESPFESIARVAFRDGGLPRPMLQVWISMGDRMIGRVDFLWEEHGTIAEADGAVKYADPVRARQQLKRDAELRRAGYEVVHFTWAELASDPDQVMRSIRIAFARAARLRDRAG